MDGHPTESFFNLKDKLRRYSSFTAKEWRSIAIVVVAFTVMVAFDDGREVFSLGPYIQNAVAAFFIIALSIVVHIYAQRAVSLERGIVAEYKGFAIGLLIGFMVTVLSLGKLYFLAAFGPMFRVMPQHRLGYFRYGLTYWYMTLGSLAGPMANLALAFMFKLLEFLPSNPLVQLGITVNVVMAISNMIPIPPLAGTNIIYTSRGLWAFCLGMFIVAGILLLRAPIVWALLGTLAGGIFTSFVFLRVIEPKVLKA